MKDVSFVVMKKEIFLILIQIKKTPVNSFKRVEWILIYLGYMLEEDVAFAVGFFGPKTRLGLQKFQAEMEIVPNEPATYDKKTREILKKTVDEYLSSSPNKKNNRSKL